MNYYKDKKVNQVYAYDDNQLEQVARLTTLEQLIADSEPAFIDASSQLQHAEDELNCAKERFEFEKNNVIQSDENNEELQAGQAKILEALMLNVDEKTEAYNEALSAYNQAYDAYNPLKLEYDAVTPVIFDIRENIKVFKKMSEKEIDAYLNPPISKEQLIEEAEQQKQSLLAEANNAIAPLQDAVDLDMTTDEETAQLIVWKKYRILLNRVDTSTAPDIDWPEKPKG